MSRLRGVARYIRHLPGLERAEWLWSMVRAPYHAAVNVTGGARIRVGGIAWITIPAEFGGGSWETFECEAISQFFRWVAVHDAALVLDIGCSHGLYSAVALFASPRLDVVAFDADIASLVQARRFCARADGGRLRLVWGLVGERASGESGLIEAAVERTRAALAQSRATGEWETTRYVCIEATDVGAVPRLTLDALFPVPIGRPVVIKCDIEGAELLMLQGATEFIAKNRPAMLLSVHPPVLPLHGHSTEAVARFLADRGYEVTHLTSDHEEHWWCAHSRAAAPDLTSAVDLKFLS